MAESVNNLELINSVLNKRPKIDVDKAITVQKREARNEYLHGSFFFETFFSLLILSGVKQTLSKKPKTKERVNKVEKEEKLDLLLLKSQKQVLGNETQRKRQADEKDDRLSCKSNV